MADYPSLLQLVQNDNRSGLAPLKPGKNTLTPDELWWQDYMNDYSRQFNNGKGGMDMRFMPAPANDARNADPAALVAAFQQWLAQSRA